jgi:hypothetical protein
MTEALRVAQLKPGPVPVDYRPPVSTFPLTRAAREALRMTQEAVKRRERSDG